MTLDRIPQANQFVSGFSRAQLAKLASLAQECSFEENDLILIAHERSKAFYVLLSGSASVEMETAFYTVGIQALTPGDAFGWSSLLDSHDTVFQVRARERCAAMFIGGEAMAALCREDPELGVTLLGRVLQTVAGRIHGLELSLARFCGFPASIAKPLGVVDT